MTVPSSRRALLRRFKAAPERVRDYFTHLPTLLAEFPLEVSLSYVFSQVELAHNMTLYCGAVKLHRANAIVTRKVIDAYRVTRDGFREMFEVVFGKPIPTRISERLAVAERIRDRVLHGKSTKEMEKREAIGAVLDYAEAFNDFVHSAAKLRPFGDLRGFKGRAKALDASTTRWMLKGMGFPVS